MIIRKIMLLGEIGVGKTSIVRRLVLDRFDADYKATIGTDVYRYEVRPSPAAEPFHFVVWDTDGNFGQSIFRSVHVKQAHAALIVSDGARRATIETMSRLAEGFADAMPGRYLGLVVNKLDLFEEGAMPPLPPATAPELPLFKTSAKTGLNVREAFHEAAATIVRRE
jgi:small GTP-binding protein